MFDLLLILSALILHYSTPYHYFTLFYILHNYFTLFYTFKKIIILHVGEQPWSKLTYNLLLLIHYSEQWYWCVSSIHYLSHPRPKKFLFYFQTLSVFQYLFFFLQCSFHLSLRTNALHTNSLQVYYVQYISWHFDSLFYILC